MRERDAAFDRELDAFFPGVIGLIGGGGKTSLLFALGRAFAAAGDTVLLTTTTRMFLPEKSRDLDVVLTEDPGALEPVRSGAVYAARPPTEATPDKVRGFSAAEVDALRDRPVADWIVAEADGAARRPLKAPAAAEPVVPSRTAYAVAVLGLGCMGRPFADDVVFRLAETAALTGLAEGERITPAAVARLVVHPDGMFKGAPPAARRIVFCNQSDLPGAQEAGEALARELARTHPGRVHDFLIGSLQAKGLRCLSCPTNAF